MTKEYGAAFKSKPCVCAIDYFRLGASCRIYDDRCTCAWYIDTLRHGFVPDLSANDFYLKSQLCTSDKDPDILKCYSTLFKNTIQILLLHMKQNSCQLVFILSCPLRSMCILIFLYRRHAERGN